MYRIERGTETVDPHHGYLTVGEPICGRVKRLLLAFLALALVVLPANVDAGDVDVDDVTLAPHRAVYEMTLNTVSDGVASANGKGRMVYEFRGGACKGYTISMRWVAEWSDDSGDVSIEDLRYASFEDGAGASFTFNSTRYRDRDLIEEMQASAERGLGGAAGQVLLSKPDSKTAALPAETIFPTAHMKKVIARAVAGNTTATDRVYDVSEDGVAVYNTFTLVAPLSDTARKAGVALAPSLGDLPAWSATVSYFLGADGGETLPSYEQTFALFGNGVATRMRLATETIVIDADLGQIEFLESPKCKN